MLVLLIGFPSSTIDFSAFADSDDDDYDDDYDDDDRYDKEKSDKKDVKAKHDDDDDDYDDDYDDDGYNKNLKVSAEESKAYKKQKEKAEEAREKAQERKEKLKEKYDKEIEELREKAKKPDDKQKEKYERELKKFQEKVNRLDKDDDHDYDDDHVTEFNDYVEIDYSSKTTVLCHYPPGNPDNAKTLTIGTKAVRAHVYNHGDSLGECGGNAELDLEERDYQLSKKHLKLEELRSKFAQKQIELAQKFTDKLDKLSIKYAEIQQKRAAKLLEKVESGEYYKDFIEVDAQLRTFVISFDVDMPLEGEPIGKSSEISEFSGSITLKTSSSTDTRGTTKFIVEDCELSNGDITYSCEYGKARTTSSGQGGEKDSLIIIATLGSDDQEKRTGLKLSISTGEDIRALEEGSFDVTVLSPQSKITHEWFLGGPGEMTVTTESSEGSNGT